MPQELCLPSPTLLWTSQGADEFLQEARGTRIVYGTPVRAEGGASSSESDGASTVTPTHGAQQHVRPGHANRRTILHSRPEQRAYHQ